MRLVRTSLILALSLCAVSSTATAQEATTPVDTVPPASVADQQAQAAAPQSAQLGQYFTPDMPSSDAPYFVPNRHFYAPPPSAKLLGFIAPTDRQFLDFISPMTNPVYFEDPRTLTEARPIFVNHHVPNALGGGNVQLYAVQLRAALTDRLSIIATKDGFFVSQNGLVGDGWANLNGGLKYNIYKDACTQSIVSAGATIEAPIGSYQAQQGRGASQFHLFLTGGTEFLQKWHYVTGSGFRLPANTTQQTEMWYWSNHVDRRLGNTGFYLFTEANWYHWMSSGSAFPAPVEGLDVFNLGSVGVAGNNIVTGAFGIKYKPTALTELGIAYEIPYTSRRDILQNRLTVDAIFRF